MIRVLRTPRRLLAGAAGLAVLAAGGVAGASGLWGDQAAPVPAAVRPVAAVAPAAPTLPPPGTPSTPIARSSPPAHPAAAPRLSAPVPVRPLTALAPPDAYVTLAQPLSAAQVAAVRALTAVTSVTIVDTGTITVGGVKRTAVGVDPSSFRAVTPEPSARSDGLWQVVARGDLTAAYGDGAPPPDQLGRMLSVHAHGTRQVRLGALAAFGLDTVQVVVSHSRARQLGLLPRSGLVVSAANVEPTALRARLAATTGGTVELLGQAAAAVDTVQGGGAGRPRTWRELYVDSARSCPGLSWTVLAAIGQVESGHGRNNGPSSAGAVGPMQFLPTTFALYAVDGDHDGKADPWDAFDAVPTAARLLCTDGAGLGGAALSRAVFAYNHADWYVAEVLALARRYH